MREMLWIVIGSMAVLTALASPARAGEGALDKDQIRDVVRAHIGEIRDCYNQGLERDPELAGKVMVGFEISATGAVSRSEVDESTLKDAQVAACIAGAIKTWQFPAPKGGAVAVKYPFLLEPG